MTSDGGTRLDGGRVLLTGAAGMLGSQLWIDTPPGFEVVATDCYEPATQSSGGSRLAAVVDLTEQDAVRQLFSACGPFDGWSARTRN